MRNSFYDTRTGAVVDEHTALDARGVVRDGFAMRTKLTLMDGMPVVDAGAVLTAQQKSDAIDARDRKLSNAWRNSTPDLPVMPEQHRPVAADGAATRESYQARITNAWRS
jgi:hypothetical protein